MFFAPMFINEELEEYHSYILGKSGMCEEDYVEMSTLLFEKIVLLQEQDLLPYFKSAEEIVSHIDPDDTQFIACALAIDGVLWSDDAALQQQDRVRIITTKEMKRIIHATQ